MERAEQRVKQRCHWEDGGGREGKNRLKMEVILTKRSHHILIQTDLKESDN
jgi:hypothetical protein